MSSDKGYVLHLVPHLLCLQYVQTIKNNNLSAQLTASSISPLPLLIIDEKINCWNEMKSNLMLFWTESYRWVCTRLLLPPTAPLSVQIRRHLQKCFHQRSFYWVLHLTLIKLCGWWMDKSFVPTQMEADHWYSQFTAENLCCQLFYTDEKYFLPSN